MLLTQSDLSQKTFSLQVDYYSVASIDMESEAINEPPSTEKHVGSLQLELAA